MPPLALVIATADLAVALWLWRSAGRAGRPEPARITALALTVCAVVLVGVHASNHWLTPDPPKPTPPPPAASTNTA